MPLPTSRASTSGQTWLRAGLTGTAIGLVGFLAMAVVYWTVAVRALA